MLKGQEGQSIKGITKTGTDGLVDTYTITLTDGTTSTFTVTNGAKGDKGDSIPSGGTAGQFLKKKSNTDYDYVWETLYPVGSIYISANSTSPAELFGGTWEQLKDRFLLATGNTYRAGSTGGEATHTLSIDELPSHTHTIYDQEESAPGGETCPIDTAARITSRATKGKNYWWSETRTSGRNKAHNNMPPYLAVYMWKRIA